RRGEQAVDERQRQRGARLASETLHRQDQTPHRRQCEQNRRNRHEFSFRGTDWSHEPEKGDIGCVTFSCFGSPYVRSSDVSEPETLRRASEGPLSDADEEVVRRIRAGETHLFELVMRRYNQRLY